MGGGEMGMSRSLHGSGRGELTGSRNDRNIGMWSARVIFAIGAVYAATMIVGFVSLGNVHNPLPDPHFAIAELLIILMAPVMVILMAAIHACAPPHARVFSLTAFGWMLLVAALTITVHFVELTVARRVESNAVPGFPQLFSFEWPSMLYAIDIVAWDLFLGLSLLFAAPVFTGQRYTAARRGLVLSGSLCLAGLIGPAIDVLAWRVIGIFGYAVILPLTCLALSRAFASTPSSDANTPLLESSAMTGPATDQPRQLLFPDEFSQSGEHVEDEPAAGSGGVQVLVQRGEPDLPLAQVTDVVIRS